MEIVLHLKSITDASFLVNGVFLENNSCVKYRDCEAVYVTVFPLLASLLPYTTKFVGPCPQSNEDIVSSIKISNNKFLAVFDKRYNYVYSPFMNRPPIECEKSSVHSFFDCVKNRDFDRARAYLTEELSSSIDDESLFAFFSPYRSMIKNESFVPSDANSYFLLKDNQSASLHTFVLKNNLIDNIIENENS